MTDFKHGDIVLIVEPGYPQHDWVPSGRYVGLYWDSSYLFNDDGVTSYFELAGTDVSFRLHEFAKGTTYKIIGNIFDEGMK